MKKYHPLVLQKLAIRIPGIHLRQLAVHRHLPETTAVSPHAHKFCQFLLYLTGKGLQQIEGRDFPVATGTAVFLPPRVLHAFRREANRRPICLVLDFDWPEAKDKPPQIESLSTSTLHGIRQQLARIVQLQAQPDSGPPVHISAGILNLLESLLAGTALSQTKRVVFQSPVARKLSGLLAASEFASLPLGQLARTAGYQHDYLNRLLKRHDGLTLGQMRANKLVSRAQQLLPQSDSIAGVAEAIGFSDPNYFARWFRKHTGVSPGKWRTRTGILNQRQIS